jgi:hypothetical protein
MTPLLFTSAEVSMSELVFRSSPPVAKICVTDACPPMLRFATQQLPSLSTTVREGWRYE